MENNLTLLYMSISALVGIAFFSLSSALTVWSARNRTIAKQRAPLPVFSVLGPFILKIGVLLLVFFITRSFLPYTKLEAPGLLVGDDLLTVRSERGFVAQFPKTDKSFTKDDVLITFRRSPDAGEKAAAMLKRDLVLEKIRLERLKTPTIDAATLTLRQSMQRRINELNERERQLLQQITDPSQTGSNNTIYSDNNAQKLERDIETLGFKINQQSAVMNIAQQELESAERIASEGLVSRLELSRKRESFRVSESRYQELKSEQKYLMKTLENLNSASNEQLKEGKSQIEITKGWLTDVRRERSTIQEQLGPVEKALAGEEVAASERVSVQIKQLQIELDELERIISGYEEQPTAAIKAPWDGIVGFRDSSPGNIKAEGKPLVIAYQPGTVYVSIRMSHSEYRRVASTKKILVTNELLKSRRDVLTGTISDMVDLGDDAVVVKVAIDPPGYLLEDLAASKQVDMTASFINAIPDRTLLAGLLPTRFDDGESNSNSGGPLLYTAVGMLLLLLLRSTWNWVGNLRNSNSKGTFPSFVSKRVN